MTADDWKTIAPFIIAILGIAGTAAVTLWNTNRLYRNQDRLQEKQLTHQLRMLETQLAAVTATEKAKDARNLRDARIERLRAAYISAFNAVTVRDVSTFELVSQTLRNTYVVLMMEPDFEVELSKCRMAAAAILQLIIAFSKEREHVERELSPKQPLGPIDTQRVLVDAVHQSLRKAQTLAREHIASLEAAV